MPSIPVSTGILNIHVEVDLGGQLADLGKHIKTLDRAMATSVRKQIRTGITRAGADLISAVRAEASWSSRIPGAVSLKTSFGARSAGVTVVVNAKRAPHARPLEFGNKNVPQVSHLSLRHRAPAGRALRHPVFPDPTKTRDEWIWVDQEIHPFFFAGVAAATPLVEARMRKVLDDVAADLGFTGP